MSKPLHNMHNKPQKFGHKLRQNIGYMALPIMALAAISSSQMALSPNAVANPAHSQNAQSTHDIVFTDVDQSLSLEESLSEKDRQYRSAAMQDESWFIDRLDEEQLVLEGQKLDPKLQFEFQERRKSRADAKVDYNDWLFKIWSTEKGRKGLRDAVDVNWVRTAYDIGTLKSIQDFVIPGPDGNDIEARIYKPEGDMPKPALIYFHGGGYLMASIKAVEPQVKILAKKGDMVVISINYRLAPEAVFPAAQHDALAAWDFIVKHAEQLGIDPERIGVGGDSAGGNLAAIISEEQIRKGATPPKAQLLYYPFADAQMTRYKSFDIFGNGFGLDKNFIKRATESFLSSPDDKNHRWLDLVNSLSFDKHPPTIVATAGYDPIRDQGWALADKLEAADRQVVRKHYPSLNHGFLEASAAVEDARRACFDTAIIMGGLLRQ